MIIALNKSLLVSQEFRKSNCQKMTANDEGQLHQFVAQETQLFYSHIRAAISKYQENGELPHSLFGVKAVKALQKASKQKSSDKIKRKPTVFNLFVKEKLAEIGNEVSAQDLPYKERFGQAAAKWSALSEEEKKRYAEKFAAELQAGGDEGEQH